MKSAKWETSDALHTCYVRAACSTFYVDGDSLLEERQSMTSRLKREPMRLFFAWGLALSVAGVLLWPLFLSGWLKFLPGVLHARLMILGFGGSCLMGWAGTAGRRAMGHGPLGGMATGLLLVLHAMAMLTFARLQDETGCWLMVAALGLLVVLMLSGWVRRTKPVPAAWPLVLAGILCGMAGCVLSALNLDMQNAFLFRFTRLLMNEAFLLLPLLGSSGCGLVSWVPSPEGKTWQALLAGLLIVGALAVEATRHISLGAGLRFCLITAWWAWEAPGLWRVKAPGTSAWMVKLGLGFATAAPLVLACDPAHLIAMEHILFITGFGLTILGGLVSAARQTDEVSKPLRWAAWLAVLGMSTRVSADFSVKIQNSHYIYAALTWVIIVVIWLRVVRRRLKTGS